jgi:chemotaxis signal transduction protein
MTLAQSSDRKSFVLLQIGERRFALKADAVAELAPPVKLHTFPHTSPSISGVIVRRGHVVPVYDAGPMLMGKSSAAQRFYLIARRRNGKAPEFGAIPVNGECELATADLLPTPEGRPVYVSGTLTIGEESVEVLDLDALIASNSAFMQTQGNVEQPS